MDDLNLNLGNYSVDQLDNANVNFDQLTAHNRRTAQLRALGALFTEIDAGVDDFRDSVSRKLDQFAMNLQKEKIPFGTGFATPGS